MEVETSSPICTALPNTSLSRAYLNRQTLMQTISSHVDTRTLRPPSHFSINEHQPQSAATYSRWFLARGFFYPEDGGDKLLRNVGSHKIYTARVCSHLFTLVPRSRIFLP
jgi:hypothetical protein